MVDLRDLKSLFHTEKPLLSAMALAYHIARDENAFEKTQDEMKLRSGQLTGEQVSRTVNIPRSILAAQGLKRAKSGAGDDHIYFMFLLNDMRQRLSDLERQMEKRLGALREKYGENVVQAMAEAYLSDEERSGLETDKDKLRALAEKFLDENGQVKKPYRHLEEALYVRDWHEAQALEPIVTKYEGRSTLTAKEKAEILETAIGSSLTDNDNKIILSENNSFQQTVDNEREESRAEQELVKTNSLLPFG